MVRALHLLLACFASQVFCAAVSHCNDETGQCSATEQSSLLQSRTVVVKNDEDSDDDTRPEQEAVMSTGTDHMSCSALKNKGSHFTVEISVGTPAQKFDVVADTGSNSVIVSSCICQTARRGCAKTDRCFTGTDRSSSFDVKYHKVRGKQFPSIVGITFGSGKIKAVIASDVVSVGLGKARMNQSLLLMVDRAELKISGAFEGILGLGLPNSIIGKNSKKDAALNEDDDMTLKRLAKHHSSHHHHAHMGRTGFLVQAGIPRFSVCANTGKKDGVLRLSQPAMPDLLSNVGKSHWSVELSALSVGEGKATHTSKLCSRSSMKPGQTTPCAIIPDSGTTVMMGPAEHITALFADACLRWPRCIGRAKLIQKDVNKLKKKQKKATKKSGVMSKIMSRLNKLKKKSTKASGVVAKIMSRLRMKLDITKSPKMLAFIFQKLLLACNSYVNASHGLDQELPPIHFHVAGSNGKKQKLTLAGVDYVYETMKEDIQHVRKVLYGIFPVKVPVSKGIKRVCTPAFGKMSYNTKLNGPVWIVGLPLFYKFQVGYELNAKPPSMSFTEKACGTCGEDSLVQAEPALLEDAQTARTVRHPQLVRGAHRLPTLDVNEPL